MIDGSTVLSCKIAFTNVFEKKCAESDGRTKKPPKNKRSLFCRTSILSDLAIPSGNAKQLNSNSKFNPKLQIKIQIKCFNSDLNSKFKFQFQIRINKIKLKI